MYVKINAGGHEFTAALYEIMPGGSLANGAKSYTARVEFSRDGVALGRGRWDGEGFDDCQDLRGGSLYIGEPEGEVWEALTGRARAHLSSL